MKNSDIKYTFITLMDSQIEEFGHRRAGWVISVPWYSESQLETWRLGSRIIQNLVRSYVWRFLLASGYWQEADIFFVLFPQFGWVPKSKRERCGNLSVSWSNLRSQIAFLLPHSVNWHHHRHLLGLRRE